MENLKTLNKNTKKAQGFIESYNFSSNKPFSNDIETFYKKPSYNKIKAWRHCQELCNKNNGFNLHITGGNSSFFSAGFIFNKDNKKYLSYITYANNFCIELD